MVWTAFSLKEIRRKNQSLKKGDTHTKLDQNINKGLDVKVTKSQIILTKNLFMYKLHTLFCYF